MGRLDRVMRTQSIPTSGIARTSAVFSPQTTPAAFRQVDTRPSGMDPQKRTIDSGNQILTDPEACEHLRFRQRQLYTYLMQGVIPFIRIGRSIRYRLRDLDAAIDAMTVVSLADATRKSGNNIGQPSAETPAPNTNPVPQP